MQVTERQKCIRHAKKCIVPSGGGGGVWWAEESALFMHHEEKKVRSREVIQVTSAVKPEQAYCVYDNAGLRLMNVD